MQRLIDNPIQFTRAYGPSFFVLVALGGALATSSLSGYLFWWAGIAFLVPVFLRADQNLPSGALTGSVLIYLLVLGINALFINPVYQAKGVYFIAYLLLSFSCFSKLTPQQSIAYGRIALTVTLGLVLWGIIQRYTGQGILVPQGPRANAIFYTPNTFAAFLNLLLLPLIARYVFSQNRSIVPVLLVFLGLVSTVSRGGLLAFSAGLIVLGGLTVLLKLPFKYQRLVRLIAGLLLVLAIDQVLTGLTTDLIKPYELSDRFSNALASGIEARLVLYGIAWDLIKEAPWFGHGYFNFQYFFQRDQVAPYLDSATKFVHNDYLQIWLETGIFGLIALLSIPITLFYSAWHSTKHALTAKNSNEQADHSDTLPLMLGLVAGSATTFAHALVDFPLYPPALLLLLGAEMGMINRLSADITNRPALFGRMTHQLEHMGLRSHVLSALLLSFLVIWLALPALAESIHQKARQTLVAHNTDTALKLFRLARALAPYEPMYYLTEGLAWRKTAVYANNRELAMAADRLFEAGAAVHPYRFENLYSRLKLNQDFGSLLDNPATPESLLKWNETIRTWHPNDISTQLDTINILRGLGRKTEAQGELDRLRKNRPNLKFGEQKGRIVRLEP